MSDRLKVTVRTPNDTDVRVNHIGWDEYFMSIAILSSLRSKDTNTKVGAAIVTPERKVASLGYNGMPTGVDDRKIPWARSGEDELDTKYPYVCHAELNAVLNASRDLSGCTLYVTLFPCNECAKAIIQVGIKRIVFLDDKYHDENISRASRKLFQMAGVKMETYSGRLPKFDFGDIGVTYEKEEAAG